jgi:hypothetical protein
MNKFIGLDVSADKIDICWLDGELSIAPRDFYESPNFAQHHEELPYDFSAAQYIQSLNPEVVILEPTGKYGRFWVESFRKLGVRFLLANQTFIKQTRKALGGSSNKNDPFDCLVLLECYFDKFVRRFDRRFWVIERTEAVEKIRHLLLDIDSVTKKSTQLINSAKQRLKVEYPTKSNITSHHLNGKLDPNILPGWWAWVAQWEETETWKLHPPVKKRFENEYNKAMSQGNGSGFSDLTRDYAKQICMWHQSEARLEQELLPLLYSFEFDVAHQVFDQFGFAHRERAWILTRIHPFDQLFLPIPKYRGKRRFRQALGAGSIESKSGKSGEKRQRTGCAEAYSIIQLYRYRMLEKGIGKQLNDKGHVIYTTSNTRHKSEVFTLARNYYIERLFTESGNKKKGRARQDVNNATCRKIVELLFEAFYRVYR